MEAFDASNIATHYYKIGHVTNISYYAYQLASASDQGLLELELDIRFKHPKILITYYNKFLYYFHFDHNSAPLDLTTEYPELALKAVNSITAEALVNPVQKTSPPAEREDSGIKDANVPGSTPTATENIPYINLGLLKALKKLVLFNLSKQKLISIFGNYAVSLQDDLVHYIVYIDAMLLVNGDILLCVFQKTRLSLFSSAVLSIDTPDADLNSNFVIYIIPSGIRCHLFDSLKIFNSFTYTPPKNYDSLIHLLNLSTGVNFSQETNILWVKLIPNLQHLNNQASKISKFIHTVDNKKYILWPWRLCLLQFGKTDESINRQVKPDFFNGSSDPLSLISDFIDFNISAKQQIQVSNVPNSVSQTHPPFSVPSVLSNGMGSHDNKPELEVNDLSMIPDIFSGMPPSVNDLFEEGVGILDNGDPTATNRLKQEELGSMPVAIEPSPLVNHGNDEGLGDNAELDDLFGDGGDSDSEAKEGDNGARSLNDDQTEPPSEDVIELRNDQNFPDNNLFKIDQVSLDNQSSDFLSKDLGPASTIIDIPKDQMTISTSTKDTPYGDPGAPLPMLQTPIIPQTSQTRSRLQPGGGTDSEEGNRSAFSPIVFNPLIRNNIDTKYGKGGKFYVEKEALESEPERKTLRATSVSGLEIKRPEDFRKGLGIEFKDKDEEQFLMNEKAVDDDMDDDITDDGNDDADDDDADDEEEVSDEDDDHDALFLKGDSPLRLNTQNEAFTFHNPAPIVLPADVQSSAKPQAMPMFSVGTVNNTGPFSSPLSSNLMMPSTKFNPLPKFDSPFAIQESPPVDVDKNKYNSPLVMDQEDFKKPMTTSNVLPTPMSNDSKNSAISESSNCLPLILRGINVTTIPNEFLLHNIPGAVKMLASASDFDMDMDEDDKDFGISKKNEMTVKLDNLDDFLSWLGPNLIFDLGLNNCKKNLRLDLPNQVTIPNSEFLVENNIISEHFENNLLKAFPLSYRVKLDEFLSDLIDKKEAGKVVDDLDNQLSFLDDITNDQILNPKSKLKKLNQIEWDSIYLDNERNTAGFNEYMDVLHDIKENFVLDPNEAVNPLGENKVRVLKNKKDIINLNSLSTKFWKYLNFNPINGEKNFQILLISEYSTDLHNRFNEELLDSLIYNYKECNFGEITRVDLQTTKSRNDLESINNGLLLVEKTEEGFGHVYKQINRKLNGLVELIKLDLINKANKFELDRPLLLFFINFNRNVNSLAEISKVCRNFKANLKRHQIPIVKVFSKIVPYDAFLKEYENQRYLKYLSSYKLTRLSMNLYNQCPSAKFNANDRQSNLELFTNLVREPPSRINFKFFNGSNSNKDAYSSDDAFLHLAYERSIDKNWVSAAWSDSLGIINYTKSWCNSSSLLKSSAGNSSSQHNNNNSRDRNVYYLNTICDQVFEISNELFKKLNEEIIKRTSGLGGKKFLVLTRVNSVIPDDELIHWKRLSLKYKDISLIVLSVSSLPKILFRDETVAKKVEVKTEDTNGAKIKVEPASDQSHDFFRQFNELSNSNNPAPNTSHLMTSPAHNINFNFPAASFLSPDSGSLTTNAHHAAKSTPTPSNFDIKDMVLQDPAEQMTSIIPKSSLPSFNSPTRIGMKIGMLVKRLSPHRHEHLVYEINLLSCSNYWNLTSLMKVILNHYKKLITLNDVLGTRAIDDNIGDDEVRRENHAVTGLVPWHVAAVSKALDYLVHIEVEE